MQTNWGGIYFLIIFAAIAVGLLWMVLSKKWCSKCRAFSMTFTGIRDATGPVSLDTYTCRHCGHVKSSKGAIVENDWGD